MSKKHTYENLVQAIPLRERKGRKKLKPNLSFDFERKLFYVTRSKKGKRKTKTFANPYDAERYLDGLEKTEHNVYYELQNIKPSEMTLKNEMERYVEENRDTYEAATEKFYNVIIKRICGVGKIGDIPFEKVSVDDIKNCLKNEKEKYSLSTVKKDDDFLKMVFSKAYAEGRLNFNPRKVVDFVEKETKLEKKRVNTLNQGEIEEFYSNEQAKEIVKVCMSHLTKDNKFHNEDSNNIYAWGILISILTGMRREEVLALKFTDIECTDNGVKYFKIQNARTIECENDKTKSLKTQSSYRYATFTPEIDQLMEYVQNKYEIDKKKEGYVDNGFIISYSDGHTPNPSSYSGGCKKFLKNNCDFEILNFLALRHTFATILAHNKDENGKKVDATVLSRIMGHESYRTTERYYIGKICTAYTDHISVINNILNDDSRESE